MPTRDTPVMSSSDGFSRRTVVSVGGTGLALALLARSISQGSAQEATPAAEGGMPEGLGFTVLSSVTLDDAPPAPIVLNLWRATMEPGASIPISSFPYPSVFYVEAGPVVCPGSGPRFLIRKDGTVRDVGDETVTVQPGESFYIPANVPDGARNDGTELHVSLGVDLIPAEGMATPTA
jgi:mannose-6-phosphate isomerase-like protein (cupin superfamily)